VKAPLLLGTVCMTVVLASSACGAPGVTAVPSAAQVGPPKPTVVSLTFDDGDADNYQVGAWLKQYGLRATWYIPTGLVGRPQYMTWKQLHALADDGNEIGGHTLDHVNVGDLAPEEARHQVCDDRQNLVQQGFDPVSFAYPFGGYNDTTTQIVASCGYEDARTIGAGPDKIPPINAYELRAFPYVVSDTNFSKLQRYVAGTRNETGGWVILIFHHVCEACDYFAVQPEVLNRFVRWLAEQQAQNHLKVMTVRQVLGQSGY
jgi:peptidoglycan/xylan/chitin deacetylase (PgdA/CDA1 family)